MGKILCVYYSRTENTKAAVETLSEIVGADMFDIVRISDGKNRTGPLQFVKAGMEAMSEKTPEITVELPQSIEQYDGVVIGTPVWAGRCASPVRAFLKKYGGEIKNPAYVITRMGDKPYEEVCSQMDYYVAKPHTQWVSLQPGSEDYMNRLYDFARGAFGLE